MAEPNSIQSGRVDLRLHTLTPLWTGGPDRRSDRVRETGILGSLRWWYEAIVRGLGDRACDPTDAGDRCIFDQGQGETPRQASARLCSACQLFGCTGWARSFRLRLESGCPAGAQARGPVTFKPPRGDAQQGPAQHGWVHGVGQSSGDGIEGQIVPLRGDPHAIANEVLTVLELASAWGALGARTQHGYGVFRMDAFRDAQPLRADSAGFLAAHPAGPQYAGPLPALTDFFFARFWLLPDVADSWWTRTDPVGTPRLGALPVALRRWGGDPGSICIAPAVKYRLRYGRFGQRRGELAQDVFGATHVRREDKPVNIKAKLHVSAAYLQDERWTFRVWGWLPRTLPHREDFLRDLHRGLHLPGSWEGVFGAPLIVDLHTVVWREFDSVRDTLGRESDPAAFLASLLA